MIGARLIADIAIGPTANGTATTLFLLDPLDLSRARGIKGHLVVTAAASGASDTLDVELQDTLDGVTWNTRARFFRTLGTQSASATAPFVQEFNLEANVDLQSPEKVYVTTGSVVAAGLGAGGVDIPEGTVVDGVFPMSRRKGDTTQQWQTAWRVRVVQTDVSTSASFTAELMLLAQEWQI